MRTCLEVRRAPYCARLGIWNLVRIENGPAAVTGIETATPLPQKGEKARD